MALRYILGRAGIFLVTIWAAVTINFVLPRLMPGDPVQVMFARFQGRLDPKAADALREAFGLTDAGIVQQYFTYLSNIFQGDFGISITYFPTPVSEILAQSIPWTLFLVGFATVMSFVIGTLLGIWSAWRRGSTVDTVLPTVFNVTQAFPYFWLGLIAIYFLGYVYPIFPRSHSYDTALAVGMNGPFILSVLRHAVLPVVTIVITAIGGWLLGMRNNMISVLNEDYITMAEAKGLPERRIMIAYAARNAILPNLTGFAMALGFVVGGSLLTEIVFSYPGIGYMLFRGVQAQDYPLMQATFLFISLAVLVANLCADLAYARLDPRVRKD